MVTVGQGIRAPWEVNPNLKGYNQREDSAKIHSSQPIKAQVKIEEVECKTRPRTCSGYLQPAKKIASKFDDKILQVLEKPALD